MRWFDPPDVTPSLELQRVVGGYPIVAQILAQRGFAEIETALAFLDPEIYRPAPPTDLPDLEIAADRLRTAIQRGEKILVWGDFDVDGQTATALLVDALRGLGAQVDYYIPHRMREGHGVYPHNLAPYIQKRTIDVLLTCDTGVTAHEAIEGARAAGVSVLVTDHHALPQELPPAEAVVNPQRLPPDHPARDLPGVGVAYKLVERLYELAGRAGESARLLDLVALGIVADVATQRRDTRHLLQQGIGRLREPERVGLRALIQSANLDPRRLSAEHIGFQIGPRLNALGRLDDATQAVELLTTEDEGLAALLANILDRLNERRKLIGDQIYAAAQEMLASEPQLLEFDAIVLSSPHWHPGVVGIVAARLAELYERPVVLLVAAEGEMARGSARSVAGVDIGAAFAANADLLLTHGGHPGAAGCTLDADLIPQFRRRLSTTIHQTRDASAQVGLRLDATVPLGDLTLNLANELDRLAPFGEGNPAVCLVAQEVHVVEHSGFGSNQRHRRVVVADAAGTRRELVWWDGSEMPLPGGAIDLALTLRVQDYRGAPQLQLEWLDSRPSASTLGILARRRVVDDLRAAPDPAAALQALLHESPEAVVWAEGMDAAADFTAQPRHELTRAAHLIIWTIPPGVLELEDAIGRTAPARVTLLAPHAPPHTPEGFLRRLMGLAQYAIRHYGGVVSIERLAGATGHRVLTVRRGLEWLAAKGRLGPPDWLDDARVELVEGGAPDAESPEAIQEALRALLMETHAYRAYFRRASLEALGL